MKYRPYKFLSSLALSGQQFTTLEPEVRYVQYIDLKYPFILQNTEMVYIHPGTALWLG